MNLEKTAKAGTAWNLALLALTVLLGILKVGFGANIPWLVVLLPVLAPFFLTLMLIPVAWLVAGVAAKRTLGQVKK